MKRGRSGGKRQSRRVRRKEWWSEGKKEENEGKKERRRTDVRRAGEGGEKEGMRDGWMHGAYERRKETIGEKKG